MRNLLVVAPHFPPTNAADMHRVRLSLPWFEKFGWQPRVLTIDPTMLDIDQEPLFEQLLPGSLTAHRTNAFPIRLGRLAGLGDPGIRAWPWLLAEGSRMIRQFNIDLVYFSTTVFSSMTLGPVWKRRHGTPFVLDMQDPWVSDYPVRRPGLKHRLMEALHRFGEPRTLRAADGLLAVSGDYIDTLHRRYPGLKNKPSLVLPFGGDPADFALLEERPVKQNVFLPGDGKLHGVYVGRGGRDMGPSLRILFGGLRLGLEREPERFSRIRLHFIGTDYATDERVQHTVLPVASAMGVANRVTESPHRVPYFTALQLLRDADFLVVPGSDDPQYTASKIFPYILVQRPMLAIFHRQSSVVQILHDTTSWATVQTFDVHTPEPEALEACYRNWQTVLQQDNGKVSGFEPWSAEIMARRQCELFDRVVGS
ncbi:MAG: glycosyltransferase [Proteobacteria bacterium]|jgi:hypothetical protein|nr:glycosyltransferase [Pseudomonadota bacterium]